jgi:long-chain acyl-CoA synthetase
LARWSEDLISLKDARTLDGLFLQRARRSPDRPAYMHRQGANAWQTFTWRTMLQAVARWRAALSREDLEAGDRVAILLRNCPEWVMLDQASLSLGLVNVPLYTDDRPENAAYILRDSAAKLLVVQDANRWKRLAEAIGDRCLLERVVIVESSDEGERQRSADPRVMSAERWLPAEGPAFAQRDADPEDLATIVYTSGTTGRSKGVMLSHHNLLSNTHASLTAIDCYQEDIFLSFLPLSHALERTGGYYLPMMAGASVAFARSIGQLAEDLQAVRPTVLIAVPRVFERVYLRLKAQVADRPRAVRWLFDTAVKVGWRVLEREQGRRGWHPSLVLWPLLRKRVAAQVLARLGGRLRIAVSGGAPLPKHVARLFLALGLPLIQGYGLTEASPVVSVNRLQDNDSDSVGQPLRGIQVCIGKADELLVKGSCNMLGYWNNHAATAAVLDAEGWLHTGDQGRIGPRGHLYITGRLKDILVLSNGEKVAPADMEMAIAMDPLFEQALVIGEGRSFLSALLVVNADLWNGLAREYGLDPEASESLQDPRLVKDMLKRVREGLRDFPGYAKIRRAILLLEPWSVDNGLLTPTLKVRRGEVFKRYRDEVERMYALEV